MAPSDRRPHRLLPDNDHPSWNPKKSKSIIEFALDLYRSHQSAPRGRQLDSQWQPIQTLAIRATTGVVIDVRRNEDRTRRARSAKRRTASQVAAFSMFVSSGNPSAGTRQATSPGTSSAARLVANTWRSWHLSIRVFTSGASSSSTCSALSNIRSTPAPDSRSAKRCWQRRRSGCRRHAEHIGNGGPNATRFGRSEFHPVGPTGELALEVRGNGKRQPCFADTARPRQRDNPVEHCEIQDRGNVITTSNER